MVVVEVAEVATVDLGYFSFEDYLANRGYIFLFYRQNYFGDALGLFWRCSSRNSLILNLFFVQ